MMGYVALAAGIFLGATGLTLVLYTLAIMAGGGGRAGEEHVLIGQIFIGMLILLTVHVWGVLY